MPGCNTAWMHELPPNAMMCRLTMSMNDHLAVRCAQMYLQVRFVEDKPHRSHAASGFRALYKVYRASGYALVSLADFAQHVVQTVLIFLAVGPLKGPSGTMYLHSIYLGPKAAT